MDKKISIIIPFYPIDNNKHDVLKSCVQSLPKHYETIVVWNRKEGMAKAINEGALCASGDYFLIMNDDVEYISGQLEDLCQENTVISPSLNGRIYQYIWGSCFCVPRNVWEDVGGMDDQYTISYFDDDDFILSLKGKGYQMRTSNRVVFDHPHPGLTLESMPDRDDFFQANKKRFFYKWGGYPEDLLKERI